MKSRTFTLLRSRTQRGFSLIEIMVGLAIGLVAVIIMMQAFAFSDSSKRITSGGDDAQINGGIALSGLERDIRMAGFGLNAFKLIGCTLNYTPTNEGSALTNALQIAPIIINPSTDFIPAGDANTDTLLVMYSNTNSTAEGDALISASSTAYRVTTPTSFVTGDKILPLPIPRPTTCTLTVDSVANVDSPNISVATGTTLKAGDIIFNIGNAPIIRAYAIRNGNLTMCDYTAYDCGKSSYVTTLDSDVWVPVGSGVVSLRAQYGRDTTTGTMTGVVSSYTQVTPGSSADADKATYAISCNWARMLSVRLALVARSAQYDKQEVTAAAPTWAASDAVTITLSDNTDWKHYRYRTLQTVVPMRNMIWQGGQAGYQGGDSGC